MRDMTHSHIWHDVFRRDTRLIHLHVKGNSTCATSLWNHKFQHPFMRDMTRWCATCVTWVVETQLLCVTWLVDARHAWHDSWMRDMPGMSCGNSTSMRDMTHSYIWHDLFTCGTRLMHIRVKGNATFNILLCVTRLMCAWNMTHSCVYLDSIMRVTWLIHMCDKTHTTRCKGEYNFQHPHQQSSIAGGS